MTGELTRERVPARPPARQPKSTPERPRGERNRAIAMLERRVSEALGLCGGLLRSPSLSLRLLSTLPFVLRGAKFSRRWGAVAGKRALPFPGEDREPGVPRNPLQSYFESHREGPGVWKWVHYFEAYQRHLSKFVGREVHVLEIGVYSGGSLPMWREYFGPQCQVHGVDIEEACRVYENDWTSISIGDQADRRFWKRFKQEHPRIDVLIDDGGHEPEQQLATLEEMLPHLRPGGVYVCEDVHGERNRFQAYVHGVAANLNTCLTKPGDQTQGTACIPTDFQASIHSVHMYPFLTVIEKHDHPVAEFAAPKHGTEWQPFL